MSKVYGVGIIQQGNVLRAVDALGILARYVGAGVGFDAVEGFAPPQQPEGEDLQTVAAAGRISFTSTQAVG